MHASAHVRANRRRRKRREGRGAEGARPAREESRVRDVNIYYDVAELDYESYTKE